jgi:hypothetical protein
MFSPLQARTLFLFEQVKEGNHNCGLDNLYNSMKFARGAFSGKNCIVVHGVTCKSGHGLPPYILQEEVKNQKEAEKVRGHTKAAVLEVQSVQTLLSLACMTQSQYTFSPCPALS